jgi:hypothetical protein
LIFLLPFLHWALQLGFSLVTPFPPSSWCDLPTLTFQAIIQKKHLVLPRSQRVTYHNALPYLSLPKWIMWFP